MFNGFHMGPSKGYWQFIQNGSAPLKNMAIMPPYMVKKHLNRKDGNDQKSIQLPNTFHPRHQREKRTHLKATGPQSKHYKQKAKRTVSFPKIGNRLSKVKNLPGHTWNREIVNHSRSIALVSKHFTGGWEILWERPQPSSLFLPWYTKDICSVRVKGF